MTTYRIVAGFAAYRVGDDGTVWTRWRRNGKKPSVMGDDWKLMRPGIVSGYPQVSLWNGSVNKQRKVHHLVLEAFVGPKPVGMDEACHKNGVKTDNRLCNLRWGTKGENYRDRVTHGTGNEGERCGRAKLSRLQAEDILRASHTGESQSAIAKRHGVTQGTVSHIKLRRSWRCL